MPAWAARVAALARAHDAWALPEGAFPPLPLELRNLCKGACHLYALSGGAFPPLPLELRSVCTGACHLCALSGGAVPPLPLEMRKECTPLRMGMGR